VNEFIAIRLVWLAGSILAGIVLVNFPLPQKLRVREELASAPSFLRQIFYVHWFYIVLIVAFFSALCFGFTRELAGASPLGRFLSAFMAAFWLLRILLQCLYYDREVRRAHRTLDVLYILSLVALTAIFGWIALMPAQ
jgi:hypothetical protein